MESLLVEKSKRRKNRKNRKNTIARQKSSCDKLSGDVHICHITVVIYYCLRCVRVCHCHLVKLLLCRCPRLVCLSPWRWIQNVSEKVELLPSCLGAQT